MQRAVRVGRRENAGEVHLAVRSAGEVPVGHGGQQRPVGVGKARHEAQGRPDEQLVGDEGRHRVARQTEHGGGLRPERPEGKGFRRPDGDLHPAGRPLAQLLEDHLHEVAIPDAHPAARHQRVAPGRSGLEGLRQVPLVVGNATQVRRLPTVRRQLGQEARAVGVADLARCERAGPDDELVAGRDDPYPRPAMDQHRQDSEARQHADVRCRERRTRGEDLVAHCDVVTGAPDVRAGRHLPADHHGSFSVGRLGVLDHGDGVGTGRDGGAGHDAGRLAGPYRHGGIVAGHDRVDHPQAHGCPRGVRGPDGIAVHRGVGEGRDVLLGADRLGEDVPG